MEKFIFKNISSKDMNVLIKNKLPIVPRAEKNISQIEIPGRSGCLFEDSNSYKTISYSLECNTKRNVNINKLKEWLCGQGDLILSNNDNVYYKACIVNQLDISTMVRYFNSFQVDFILQPFAYSREIYIKEYQNIVEKDLIITEATTNMFPIIEVYGNEDVNITINKQSVKVNPEEYITLDCENQEAYKDNENANSKILGDLSKIHLKPGKNELYFVGNYDKIIIKYRKMFL